MIGVLCAMPQEYDGVKSILEGAAEHDLLTYKCCTGTLNGCDVIVARTGMGKVNAALGAFVLKERFSVRLIVSAGVAGIIDRQMSVGDVVIGSEACYHDCYRDASFGSGNEDKAHVNMHRVFKTDAALLKNAEKVLLDSLPEKPKKLQKNGSKLPILKTGRIISGDIPISSSETVISLYNRYGAACVDMECAGVAQSCDILGVPFIALKIMSDYADERSLLTMFRYINDLCAYLAALTGILINGLA